MYHHANYSSSDTHRTTALIILFSQYLRLIPIPVPAYSKAKKLHTSKFYIFQIMPVCFTLQYSQLFTLFKALFVVYHGLLTLILILDVD